MATDQFQYLIEGFRLFCVGPRPQYMSVGEHGIVKRDTFKGLAETLTILEFKTGQAARECLARFRTVGYDSGCVAGIEHIGILAQEAVKLAAETKLKRAAEAAQEMSTC